MDETIEKELHKHPDGSTYHTNVFCNMKDCEFNTSPRRGYGLCRRKLINLSDKCKSFKKRGEHYETI